MKIRPLHMDEQKYTYAQSTQIEGQTGNIGYLRGDFGTGNEFYSSWFDRRRDLKTDEFKNELSEVINALRSEEYGLLKSRTDMSQYAKNYPDSAFQGNYATEYGFRADTEKHAILIRCNPARGDYNFYCYCYVREWLDRHIEKASCGIHFITPDYKEKFIIPDGDKIRITLSDGEQLDRTCRYSLPFLLPPVINRVTYSRPPAYKYRPFVQKLCLPFCFTSKNLFILSVGFHACDL